jgi:geranylgeranyl diphosphate synthase type II
VTGPAGPDWLAEERHRVDGALAAITADLADLADADPSRRGGAQRIADAVAYAVEAGGKRLRPILCVAAYRSLGGVTAEPVYRLAASLELVHTYSLIHDDLPAMDDDAVRRGRASTHIAHGVATATAAGAALIPVAAGVAASAAAALGLGGEAAGRVVRVLCQAAGAAGMVGGQHLDLEAEGRAVDLDALVGIHRRKTGALLAAAPRIGGLAAGADPDAEAALADYGAALGLAFQIADDILDVTGSTAVLGKTAGRDSELAKATFPALAGVEGARRRAREEMTAGVRALEGAGIRSAELASLARYAVERDR